MFQYEYEKPHRPQSYPNSNRTYSSHSRTYPNENRTYPSDSRCSSESGTVSNHSRRALPLPPRPEICRVPSKPTVPLKVWVVASASCFAVCAVLVLATVVITKWGTSDYSREGHYFDEQASGEVFPYPQVFPKQVKQTKPKITTTTEPADTTTINNINDDLPILEKLSIFKNIVAKNRKNDAQNKKHDLTNRPQVHPAHDHTIVHAERKIEKKDHAKLSLIENDVIPEFKPKLPEVYIENRNIKTHEPVSSGLRKYPEYDDEYYYNDENLYNDYMQSNTMTSYLIEKVQELHDWIRTDADFEIVNNASAKFNKNPGNQFGQLLKALNESLIEGNVTIVMNKLKDIYFGENYTTTNHSRKVILSNSTDLLSFGILSLDVMLLHNIQLMAWENQEGARSKMMKDPDVFAFNALFLDASKVESKYNEIYKHDNSAIHAKRQNLRQEMEDFDIGRNLLENVLEIGMSTARAAIHLGRAYKNTKMMLSQLSNRDNGNTQNQISRNIDANTNALNHLQTSFNKNESKAANKTNVMYTELDCVWLLYCKNLVATSKLNAPYGLMARINGVALRLVSGELSPDRALDTMLYEAFVGGGELNCGLLFSRCTKANAAAVVLESILQPHRKPGAPNKS